MKWLFIGSIIMVHVCSYSQTTITNNYLLLRIDQLYDNTHNRNYFVINAELGCDNANEVYALKPYSNKKSANNIGQFYTNKKDSLKTTELFNYFLSTTEAINYVSKNGWVLVTVYNEMYSDYQRQENGNGDLVPITTVGSRAIFCFKK